jgi:hypothetical protein
MIQVAWLWTRHRSGSALARWFKDRVQRNGGRMRKTAIVALARKLLVAFWKYVTSGRYRRRRDAGRLTSTFSPSPGPDQS